MRLWEKLFGSASSTLKPVPPPDRQESLPQNNAQGAEGRPQGPSRMAAPEDVPLQELLAQCKSRDYQQRQEAVSALVRSRDSEAVTAIVGALGDDNYAVRQTAESALATIRDWWKQEGANGAVPALIAALARANKKNYNTMRLDVARPLGMIGDAQAVGPLIETLLKATTNGDSSQIVEGIVIALAQLDRDWYKSGIGKGALATLEEALGSDSWVVRRSAACALGRIPHVQAAERLRVLLRDSDSDVRRAAAMALTEIDAASVVHPELQTCLSKPRLRFIDNNDGTIIDTETGLMWQKEDDGVQRTYEEGVAYCRELRLGAHDDWRLPKLKELLAIVVRDTATYHNPAFAGAKRERYWTSSPLQGHQATKAALEVVYTVDFADGHETTYFKVNKYLVRAVWP